MKYSLYLHDLIFLMTCVYYIVMNITMLCYIFGLFFFAVDRLLFHGKILLFIAIFIIAFSLMLLWGNFNISMLNYFDTH
jgi:hypothetical protein